MLLWYLTFTGVVCVLYAGLAADCMNNICVFCALCLSDQIYLAITKRQLLYIVSLR